MAVVVLGLVFDSYAWRRSGERHGARRVVLVGAVFGTLTVVLMASRLPVAPGSVYLDARVVPVALAGLSEVPATGLLGATAGAVYRLELGGAGTVAGIVALSLTAGAAALVVVAPAPGRVRAASASSPARERRWLERAIVFAQRIRDIVGRMNRIARVERKPSRPGLPPMLDIDKSSDVH